MKPSVKLKYLGNVKSVHALLISVLMEEGIFRETLHVI